MNREISDSAKLGIGLFLVSIVVSILAGIFITSYRGGTEYANKKQEAVYASGVNTLHDMCNSNDSIPASVLYASIKKYNTDKYIEKVLVDGTEVSDYMNYLFSNFDKKYFVDLGTMPHSSTIYINLRED